MRHLTYPALSLDHLGYSKIVPSRFDPSLYYYYSDEFSIPDAAPIVSPHVADIVGTMEMIDPTGADSIGVEGMTWPVFRNGTFFRTPSTLSRALGVASYHKVKFVPNGAGADSSGLFMGFFDSTRATKEVAMSARNLSSANSMNRFDVIVNSSGFTGQLVERALSDNTFYEFVTVLLSSGSVSWVRGGAQMPSWTLFNVEHSTSRAVVHHHTEFSGGFDSTWYGARFPIIRIAKPSAFWSGDFVMSTQLSDANGATAVFGSSADSISIKIGTVGTVGTDQFRVRKVDANNYAWIQFTPLVAGTSYTVSVFEKRAGVDTGALTTTTAVSGDIITLRQNRALGDVVNTSRYWVMQKNGAQIGSGYTRNAASPQGTGYECSRGGNGTYTWVYQDPYTVVNAGLITWLESLASGDALS